MYGTGTWVRTHNAWVLWEGHGMVRMLLTGCTVRVCQYLMYDTHMPALNVRTWPRGNVPGLGLTDEGVSILGGVDCGILTQSLIGLIEYSYHQGIPSFLEAQLKRTPRLSMLDPEQF
jgi:hypothetical protein